MSIPGNRQDTTRSAPAFGSEVWSAVLDICDKQQALESAPHALISGAGLNCSSCSPPRDQMEDAELMAVLRPTGGAADRLQFAPSSGAVRTGDQMPTEGQELRLQVEDAEGKGGAYRRGRQGEAP